MAGQTNKRILIISYAFWPMNIVGATRPIHVVSGLLKKGYRPVVLTTIPWDESLNDKEFGKDIIEQIEVKRVRFFAPVCYLRQKSKAVQSFFRPPIERHSNRSLIRRFCERLYGIVNTVYQSVSDSLDVIIWNAGIVYYGRQAVRREQVDCVFCTVPPSFSLVSASLVARWAHAPLVADFRDLWTMHEYHDSFAGKRRSTLRKKYDNIMERYVLQRCSRIIYNTSTALRLMDAKYPAYTERSTAVTNGIIAESTPDPSARRRNGKFRISHTGGFYGDRNPTDFLKGLKRWLDDKGKGFHNRVIVNFVGRGANLVGKRAGIMGLADVVRTEEQKSKKELGKILTETDLFLLCLGYRQESRYVTPAKMYDYIGAERPVIAFAPAEGEISKLMEELGLKENLITSPNPERVCETLEREYKRFLSESEDYSVPTALKKRYDYSSIAEQVEEVIRQSITEAS